MYEALSYYTLEASCSTSLVASCRHSNTSASTWQRPLRQYLYFCTSKASKLRTESLRDALHASASTALLKHAFSSPSTVAPRATSTFFRLFGLLDGGDAAKGEERSSVEREQEKSSIERGGGQEK